MGKRITIRGRGRGTSVADPPLDPLPAGPIAVSNSEPRVKYVRGWETGGTDPSDGSIECGHGTRYSMLVTPAQLAELMYRVKDAKLESGSATASHTIITPPYAADITVSATGGSPPTELFETWDDGAVEDIDVFTAAVFYRGYMTALDKYFYDAGGSLGPMPDWGSDYFGDTYEKRDRLYTGGDMDSSHYYIREATDNERALWAFKDYTPPAAPLHGHYDEGFNIYDGELSSAYNLSTFRTGFSMVGYAQTEPLVGELGTIGHYGVTGSYTESGGDPVDAWGAFFALETLPEVAWIDDDGSGNPLSPGNRLYLGVIFSAYAQLAIAVSISTVADAALFEGAPSTLTGGNLILKLSGAGNEISCPIYGATEVPLGNPLLGVTSNDWVFTATKWWPYAHSNPLPSPFWNRFTGEYLPPFPTVAAKFNSPYNSNIIPLI